MVDSITTVYDEYSGRLVCVYRKYNSYPSIHGAAIFKFLNGRKLVDSSNEIGYKSNLNMGCLAAEFVQEMKKGVLDISLVPTFAPTIAPAFEYSIFKDKIQVINYQGYQVFYGTWKDFETFCEPDE